MLLTILVFRGSFADNMINLLGGWDPPPGVRVEGAGETHLRLFAWVMMWTPNLLISDFLF